MSVHSRMDSDEDDNEDKGNNMSPYSKSVSEYSSASSIHGLFYLSEDRREFYEKALWFIVVVSASLFAITSSIKAYNQWQDDPILTSIATTAYPVQNVPFPSITICSQGAANEIVDAAIFKQFVDYLKEKNISYDDLSEDEVREETYNFFMISIFVASFNFVVSFRPTVEAMICF